MQQATRLTGQPKTELSARSLSGSAPGTSFVINLCSSTSPVALSPPDHAGLKRFTFFVSRRREEGRERFRLHMGYFQSQEEAEKLLDIVREIYPGAWAGLAPGQRLRAAAAASAPTAPAATVVAEPVRAAAPPAPAVRPTIAEAPVPAVAPVPAALPTIAAEPVRVAAADQTVEQPVQVIPPLALVERPAIEPAQVLELVVEQPVRPAPAAAVATASAVAAPETATSAISETAEHAAAARSLKDVRAAIASLEDTGVRTPVLRIPELKPARNIPTAMPLVAKAAEAPKAGSQAVHSAEELNDEAAMAVLEHGAKSAANNVGAAVAAKAGADNAADPQKPVFAVQLMWSVKPIDIAQVPQLAIFGAYTLYGAEGNRDGRRWYGLRLGFFTDAVSAKQVAHYVRSEFSTVSVVPVTTREKERAKLASARPNAAPVANAAPPAAAVVDKPAKAAPNAAFEFIEDKPPAAAAAAKMAGARSAVGPRAARGAPGKRAKLRNPAQAAARAKPKKLTLEETLEILGAGDLRMDDGKTALINHEPVAANAASRPQPNKAKASRLGRLFERLSERIGN